MVAKIYFSIVMVEGMRLGKLDLPHHRVADWINFLIAPKQHAQIVSADQRRTGVTLYFRGDDRLYTHISQRLHLEAEAAKQLAGAA